MQTGLEKKGIEKRQEELIRRNYNVNDPYSTSHKDAISDGDPQGKGTQHGGHTHSIPNCNIPSTLIDYSNFDTVNGGGSYDINGKDGKGGRNYLMGISKYNVENQYGAALIDTDVNRQDGQIVI